MRRRQSFTTDDRPTVRAARPAAQHVVSRTDRRDGREPGADEADRRAVLADAVLRQPQDGARIGHQSQARTALDAPDGLGGDLSEASDDAAECRAQDLPVFTAESADHAARPGVGQRHHLHSAAARLFVPDGGDGLVQPLRAGLAVVEHAGGEFLSGSARRGALREATRDFQQRPRIAIHGGGLHRPIGEVRRGDLDGRSRPRRWTTCSSSGCGGA